MPHPNLTQLLSPRSVAIVGPNDKGNPGARALQNVINVGFGGAIYPVNPNYDSLGGRKCYPSLAALPEVPDLVVSAVPVTGAMKVVHDAEAIGAPSMVLFCDGFIDLGTEEGRRRTDELKAVAARTGMAVQGPNCMGSMSLRHRFSSTFGKPPLAIKAGGISIVSQSGGLINAFLELGNARALGFNYLISGGNEAVVNAADYLEWLAGDAQTEVIICIVEGVKDGARFRAALEQAARAKPVVVLKLGRSEPGQRATLAHTGSLAGSDAIFTALCERSGATLVDTVDAALETAAMFSRVPLPRGNNIVIFSTSGGATVLTTDLAAKLNLRFPPLPAKINTEMQRIFEVEKTFINPFDVTAQPRLARGDNMTRCLETLLADDTFDLIGCVLIIQREQGGNNEKLLDQVRVVAKTASKPIILFPEATMHWLEEPVDPGVHVASSLSDGLIALHGLVQRAAFLRRQAAEARDDHPMAPVINWPDPNRRVLTEFESKKLLAAAGLPVTREALARSADEAVAAAQEIGFPVALKIQSPDLMHKSDLGGLALGLSDEQAVRQAFRNLSATVAAQMPKALVDGVLVQEMVDDGIELLVGMKRDPVFGPVIVLSPGGVFVELFETSQLRLLPLRADDAEDMVQRSGVIEKLLGGFRGRAPADRTALVGFIADFALFVERLGDDVLAVDINPVMVRRRGLGVTIVDAAIERASG